MENKNDPLESPHQPVPGQVAAEGEDAGRPGGLLASPAVLALLNAMGCHALILDEELKVVSYDPGAPGALGLRMGPDGLDILPVPARTHFASRGFRLCGDPIPLGEHRLWVYRDVRRQERREELEMIFLHELLGTLALREAGPDLEARLRSGWDLAMNLYRELVVRRMAQGAEAEAPRILAGCEPAEEGPLPAGEGSLVLVADDSTLIRRLLAAILGREFRVVTAADGVQACELIERHRPDLVLMDAVMPVMDGFALCRRLKADPRTQEIPVLFLTALQGERDEVRALEAGAIDFIQKPVTAAALLARVRNHLELRRSREGLARLAVLDGLTALANRRRFDEVLALEWQRSRREGQPLSLIMGDVDSFKAYNDLYGHVEGDACLKAVAGVFREALHRPADLAARYGGEEFVCLLPGTDEAGAQAVMAGITSALARLGIPHAHSEVAPHVTVSLGVATAYPALQEGPGRLVEAADQRMYEAKRRAKAQASKGQPGTEDRA